MAKPYDGPRHKLERYKITNFSELNPKFRLTLLLMNAE